MSNWAGLACIRVLGHAAVVFALWSGVAGCDDGGGSSQRSLSPADGGEGPVSAGAASNGSEDADPHYTVGYGEFSEPFVVGSGGQPPGEGGTTGEGGSPYPAFDAVSVTCGDRVVGDTAQGPEECDDGDEGSDACTAYCQTRDQPVLPLGSGDPNVRRSHYLGFGRHPVASGNEGFLVTFVDTTLEQPSVSASVFNRFGQHVQTGFVSTGSSVVTDANPVAAALPGGAYALAWSDFDGDGSDLGIALRRMSADRQLGNIGFANAGREFSQRDPDLLWDGSQLIAAWVDFADAERGPDIRYRTFDTALNPTSGDLSLASSELPESNVALAKVQGGWSAAYREGLADGTEYVVVKSGDKASRVGPVLGGPITDRPALVELDATHVLVVFSEGYGLPEEPANTFRLSYAVIDRTKSETLLSRSLSPLDPLWKRVGSTSYVSPSAELGVDGVYVAWRSEGLPGDAAADQVWLKRLSWTPLGTSTDPALDASEPELLLPRTCEESVGDQRVPALARTALPPHGGLAVAWEDYGRTQGAGSGGPEVVVHFAPTETRGTAQSGLEYLSETWTGTSGSAWPSRWTSELTGPLTVTVQRDAGQIAATSGTQGIVYMNDRTALDVDMVTEVRLSPAARATLFTRRADTDPSTYLAFQFSTFRDEPWRLYAMLAGVQTDVLVLPPPNNVPVRSTEQAYKVRLRTDTRASGDLFVAAKVWPSSASEPETWTLSKLLTADSLVAQQVKTPGRFGMLVRTNQNRKVTFDDLLVKLFNGAQQGDLDGTPPSLPLPLKRALATYRRCTPEAPCEVAGGCCESSADCAGGAACTQQPSVNQPLGLGANACVVDHCANNRRDADEERADCGGADCEPCACSVSGSTGTAQYCPTTCPCGTADASCTQDAQCLTGLLCTVNSGLKYGWPSGTGSCTPTTCANAKLDLGESWPDCGGDCGACTVVTVTPTTGSINAAAGMLQKVVVSGPTLLNAVTGVVEGQNLCLFTESSDVTLDAFAFNRVKNYALMPNQPACFVVDSNLLLQSTNLPAETINGLTEVAGLDWNLSNEPAQLQLNGTGITRWLASAGGAVHDAAQPTQALWPMYSGGGLLLDATRYLVGEGTPADWTFLHRPGSLFMVFRPDTAVTGYLLGTVHDSSASAGSGYGIYFDASTTPPRLRFRVGNGAASYVFSLSTTASFPLGVKTVVSASMSDTKLEAFRNHDSVGRIANTGSLSIAEPYSVALVGAKASTSKTPFPGALFEIAHYSTPLSQRARQAITQYLVEKHGIDGTPGHCHNGVAEPALGEIGTDCGGLCGCSGACASECGVTIRDFPTSDDGSYYNVNLLRRQAAFPQPKASVTYANDALLFGASVANTTDGDDTAFRWASPTGSDPDATATIVYDLGIETSVGAVRHRYSGSWIMPNRARIRIGKGTPIVWTEVRPDSPILDVNTIDTFAGTVGRYVELTMIGTPPAFGTSGGRGVVDVGEVYVYPSTAVFPGPNTSQGYDLTYLSTASATTNSNISGWYFALLDKTFTGVQGKTAAAGATGDGQVTVNLGGLFQVSTVMLSFHLGLNWTNGGKIELGVDGPTPGSIVWTTAVDTGLGAVLATNNFQVTPQLARYVRITNYFVAGQGASTGQLDEISVF